MSVTADAPEFASEARLQERYRAGWDVTSVSTGIGKMAGMPGSHSERPALRRHPGEDWIEQIHVDLVGLWESAALRVVEAYDVVVGPRWVIDLDVQPYVEVWLIRRGSCAVTLGERQGVAHAGEVVVLTPGPRRVSANASQDPLTLSGFGCSLTLLDGVDLFEQLVLPLVVASPSERLRSCINNVVEASRGVEADRIFRARAWAELALADLVETTSAGVRRLGTDASLPDLRAEVSQALAYIAEHYDRPLDVRTIAGAVYLSPQHLTRCFRESLGVPPMAYLRRHRLNRAIALLVATDQPIIDVMQAVGFSSLAHFSRAFKNQFGISPRTFRGLARARRRSDGVVAGELGAELRQ